MGPFEPDGDHGTGSFTGGGTSATSQDGGVVPGFGFVGPCLDLGVVDRLAMDVTVSGHDGSVYEDL